MYVCVWDDGVGGCGCECVCVCVCTHTLPLYSIQYSIFNFI